MFISGIKYVFFHAVSNAQAQSTDRIC
jgi:hypothetical protein